MERGAWLPALLLAGSAAWGDITVDVAPGETITLYRLDAARDPIVVDGELSEPVWQQMPAYDEFVVIEPDTLGATSHQTLIRLAYDERGLYVGAEMLQPPETLITRLSGRDLRQVNRDSINLTLDTSGEARYGFWFGVNLGDSLMDGTVLPERRFSSDWDGPWRGRSKPTERGWTAELFIPWSTVSMPAGGDVRSMGLYMSRKVAYLDERWGWPALPDSVPRFMSALQGVEMRGVAPRQQYNFYPFVSVTGDGIDDDVLYRAGADVFWRPSTNFQLNATANPDFGTVESDEVVINLTATETFFPEKRLFFLEGQEIFVATPRTQPQGGLGNAGPPYTMVYTRRIGGPSRAPPEVPGVTIPARERFQPTDLLGAVKVTGQAGWLRYGVMGAVEDDLKFDAFDGATPVHLDQSGNDYGIARLLYEGNSDQGAYRALGLLSTAVLNPERDALAHGIDAHYLTADGKLKVDAQLMTSDIDGTGKGYGGFVDFDYTFRQGMRQRVGFEYFDETFDINDLGFLQRNDRYRVRSSFGLTSSNLAWARNNDFDVRGSLEWNVSEDLFVGGGIFFSDRITFDNLSQVTARLNFLPEAYDDLNSFGNGTFRVEERSEVFLFWDSSTTGRLIYYGGGGTFNERHGDWTHLLEGGFVWRPNDRINVELNLKYYDRGGWLLHQQDDLMATFDADQWQPTLSMDYFLSARQQFRVALQWVGIRAREDEFLRIPAEAGDLIPTAKPVGPGFRPSYDFSVSRFSFQARYRWEIAPLSDLFLVYTRQADRAAALGDDSFGDLFSSAWNEPLQDVLVLKIRYRLGS